MSKLRKWTDVMKGKGIQVIDNTGTLPNPLPEAVINDLPPLPTNDEVAEALARSVAAREATYAIEPSKPTLISSTRLITPPTLISPTPPGQAATKAGLNSPSQIATPLSFAVLAEQATEPEQLVVTTIEKVFDSSEPNDGIAWADLVASAEGQAGIPMVVPLNPADEQLPPEISYDAATDFPPETPLILVSIDVPESVELVVKINGQELL